MRRIPTLSLLAVVAVLALASCGKAAEKLTEEAIEQSAGGGEVDIDDDGSFSFETDEGSMSVDDEGNVKIEGEDGEFSMDSNTGGDLPDDFPDVPLPDGFSPQNNSKQSDGDETVYSVMGTVDGDAKSVYDDIIDQYESAGYETEGQFENSSGDDLMAGANFAGTEYTVNVSVFSAEGETTVSFTILPPAE